MKAEWVQLSSGAPINDALLSGNLEFASGGIGPLLTIWAKTHDTIKVKAVGTLNAMPMWLTTTNPDVRTIRDFTDKDRIALPAVKVSAQAVILHMAAAQVFGAGQENKLDHLTVSLSHPDGMQAMLSRKSPITAHLTAAPYMYQEAEAPGVRVVLDSYAVVGGKHTFNATWTTTKYRDGNPKIVAAFVAALDRAMATIRTSPDQAAVAWAKAEKVPFPLDQAAAMIARPENEWTTAPRKIVKIGTFMKDSGAIPVAPATWRDVFFPELTASDGD